MRSGNRPRLYRLPLLLPLILAACSPESQEIQVGSQQILILVPVGWEHLDYGHVHQFRKDLALISLEEIGPARTDVDSVIESVLAQRGHNDRRNIASSHKIMINDHDVLVVDTWDRLSHESRMRFALVNGEGSLLVLYTKMGKFEKMEEAFEELLTSLQFATGMKMPNTQP